MTDVRGWKLGLAIAVLWAAVFAAYSNSFTIAFQFDDLHTVQSNAYVRSLSYIPRYFVDANTYSYRPENSGYRPMASVACALGFQLSAVKTWGYHLIKVAEHALIATLIFFLALRLLPTRGAVAETPGARLAVAFLGALVFGVHRANSETVDYITAVSTMQAGLFDLAAFLLYLRAFESESRAARVAQFAAAVLCYELAMMSKEEGVTLPAMLLAYEWIYGRRAGEGYLERLAENAGAWLRRLAPFVGAAVLFVVLRTLIQPAVADTSRGNVPRFIYFITQFRSWWHYWLLFFWPVTLNSDNLSFEFSKGLGDWEVWVAALGHALVWLAAWRAGMRRKFVLFAVAWAYVTVLPASSIFPLVEAVNEHRMYISYMMLAPLVVWLVFTGLLAAGRRLAIAPNRARDAAVGLTAVLALALGAGAYARNEVWQTEISLWEDVYAKNPDSPRALNVLGISLVNSGEYARATPLLERCHRLTPNYLPCMVHLSMAYAHYRRYQEGLELLLGGVRLSPDYPHLNYHLGIYYKDYLGRPDEAIGYLKHCVEVTQGRFFQATIKLAEVYVDKGNYAEAMRQADAVLKVDPSNGDAWSVLARAELLGGDTVHASRIIERLIESAPESTKYYFDLANLAERSRDVERAFKTYQLILSRDGSAVQAYEGMARIARATGRLEIAQAAEARIAELRATGQWTFITSLGLPGEKPGRIMP